MGSSPDTGTTLAPAHSADKLGLDGFRLPIVFGVMDLAPSGLRMHHVDCETGERWQPGVV